MRRLDYFWAALDRMPSLRGLKIEWKETFGDDLPVAEAFLEPEQELATWYPCPRPGGDGCPRRVVEHGPTDRVAVCGNDPPECEPVRVTRKDLIIYRLDVPALARGIARAFAWDGEGELPGGLEGVATLGRYCPSPGHAFPAFFALPGDDFAGTLERLVARAGGPCLMLVPTRASTRGQPWDAHIARSVHVLACSELLAWERRRLVCMLPAEEVLAPFRRLFLPDEATSTVTACCTAFTHDKRAGSALDKKACDSLVAQARGFNLFIDGTGEEARVFRKTGGKKVRQGRLTGGELAMLASYIRRSVEYDPYFRPILIGGSHQSAGAAFGMFKKMRRVVDTRLEAQTYLLFKQRRLSVGGAEYAFVPPADFRFCILVPPPR